MSTNYNNWEFALFSAHIHHYLPAIAWQDHYGLYDKWKAYHRPRPFRTAQSWEDTAINELKGGRPKIICLYHLGLHGQIPRILADRSVHFDILMDEQVYLAQSDELQRMQQEMQANGLTYQYLMSSDPQVLLKIRSAVVEGRHVLVFADGNSGVSESRHKKVQIGFLENTIYVRTGIALIAYLLNIPVVPVTHCSTDGLNQLIFGTAICRRGDEGREVFIYRCMQQLYDFLADEIRADPWRWECWGYLHELNCYEIRDDNITMPDTADIAALRLTLRGREGYFYRKNFSYRWQ